MSAHVGQKGGGGAAANLAAAAKFHLRA